MMEKNDKVLMMSSVHVWNDTRILYKEAMSLADAGMFVDFYAIDNGMPKIEYPRLKISKLSKNKKKINRVSKIIKLLKISLKSEAKFFHIHDPELLLLFPLIKLKRKDSVCIYDMHENFPKDILTKKWIPKLIRKALSNLVRKIEPKLMKFCDFVIFAEDSYVDDYKFIENKSVVVRNYPIYIPKLSPEAHKNKTLIYVGSITEDRGIWNMLKLIAKLSEIDDTYLLKLVGPMNDELRNSVNKYIENNELKKNVDICGRVNYDKLWNIYSSADIGLCFLDPLPNYINSMATKIYEYMAASLPVVASNFSDWNRLIVDNHLGMTVSPDNLDNQIKAITELANNQYQMEKFGRNGRELFEKRYNWNSEKKALLQSIYKLGV